METIYLVTSGEYSDYRVDGVFSTKKKAQAFINAFSGGGWSRMGIEEYGLDLYEKEIKNGRKPCFIRISKNGDTSDFRWESSSYGFRAVSDIGYGFDVKGNLYLHIFARDEKHAVKIASEKRAELIANGEWK